MDAIEKEIRRYFSTSRAQALGRRPAAGYPDETDIYRFLTDRLSGAELERMLEHLKLHEDDRRFVARTRELLAETAQAEREEVPAELISRVRAAAPRSGAVACPHCRGAITPFKRPLGRQKLYLALWLAAGAVFFGVSFLVPRYFVQWTVLGALCLVKCIVDAKAVRTQIIVYKALSEASEAKTRHLHPTDTPL